MLKRVIVGSAKTAPAMKWRTFMANIIQAQYDGLAKASKVFAQHANSTLEMMRQIAQLIEDLRADGWQGKSANAFFSEMYDDIYPAMRRLIDSLSEVGAATQQIAKVFTDAEEEAGGLFRGDSSVTTKVGSVSATALAGGGNPLGLASLASAGSKHGLIAANFMGGALPISQPQKLTPVNAPEALPRNSLEYQRKVVNPDGTVRHEARGKWGGDVPGAMVNHEMAGQQQTALGQMGFAIGVNGLPTMPFGLGTITPVVAAQSILGSQMFGDITRGALSTLRGILNPSLAQETALGVQPIGTLLTDIGKMATQLFP
jgi:WXG100 family type VII secretion target